MLKHGADTTMANKVNSWTALHCFAWKGEDVDALDLLLNHLVGGVKPDINARDCEGNTPLHILLWRRQVPKVLLQAFVRRGANVNEENLHSARPLQMACLYGDLETLRDLCHGSVITDIDDVDNDGDTALQQAVIGNHIGCVKFLVEFGANPNIANNSGKAALHKAALHSTRDCIEILLKHGAAPNKLDNDKHTPLFCACLGASATEDKAKLLLDTLLGMEVPLSEINCLTKGQRSPLREAAGHGFEYIVEKMIKTAEAANDFASLALDVPDNRKGMTPLHRAAWLGRTGCVRLLLEANADVMLWDNDGKTALTLANEQWALASNHEGYEEILSLLIDADTGAAASDSELVAVCALNGSLRLLEKLANIGADLTCQDRYGWTPIELARNHQQEEASRFLKRKAAWTGMLPSEWEADSRTDVLEDGTTVVHLSGDRVCISTNRPLPAGLDRFYFEIGIENVSGDDGKTSHPALAVGFCTIGGSAISFPGWPPRGSAPSARSWGYHGNDGCLYESCNASGNEIASERPYGRWHVIGCGVDLTTQTIWFTRNGRRLASEFQNVQGRLFPVLGLKDGVRVRTNFAAPFMWQESSDYDFGNEGMVESMVS
jgi:ankyrin repeat protein